MPHKKQKMKLSIMLLAILMLVNAKAQIKPPSLPLLTLSELDKKTWTTDSLAEAVVLSDVGESRFYWDRSSGWHIQFTRRTKIKILSEAGLQFANVQIPLYKEEGIAEVVNNIQGNVYNIENGTLTTSQFDNKFTYQEQVNNNWDVIKFALPNVRPGSTIEYSYVLLTPFKFNLPDWEFQWTVPVDSSSYTLGLITYFEYTSILQGAPKFSSERKWEIPDTQKDKPNSYKEFMYQYTMKDVPAFRDEDFITSRQDNIIKMDFQLSKTKDYNGKQTNVVTTWKELSKELDRSSYFGEYIKQCERHYKRTFPFVANVDTLENAKRAIEYIKSNYEWNQIYSLLTRKSKEEFITQKIGNSAEKNLMAIGLLHSMGIKAYPVLISTRSHGRIASNYPFLNAFNHVLILLQANNTSYIFDATDPSYPSGLLPLECINNNGYIVDKKNFDNWIALSTAKPSLVHYTIDLQPILKSDSIDAKINILANHYDAIKLRNVINKNSDELGAKLFPNLNVDTVTFDGVQNQNKPIVVNAIGKLEMDKAMQVIIISPFAGLCDTKNLFKAEKRTYPVDLTYAFQRTYNTTIEIPEGYMVSSAPINILQNNDFVQFWRQDKVNGNKLTISAYYRFPKAIYPPEEYAQLKSAFAQMISRLNTAIILAPVSSVTETTMN
jgi:hypothetical protein